MVNRDSPLENIIKIMARRIGRLYRDSVRILFIESTETTTTTTFIGQHFFIAWDQALYSLFPVFRNTLLSESAGGDTFLYVPSLPWIVFWCIKEFVIREELSCLIRTNQSMFIYIFIWCIRIRAARKFFPKFHKSEQIHEVGSLLSYAKKDRHTI